MSMENTLDLQYCIFLVDDRPFCLWDSNHQKRTLDFIENIDSSYFEYMADKHFQDIDDTKDTRNKNSQRAALAMRITYSQALETLFALIGAAIQAPNCVHAWMTLYQNHELRNVINKIHNGKPILSLLKSEILSWFYISEVIFDWLVMDEKEKIAMKEGFAKLWNKFASDFLDIEFSYEYNSIKHGLRIQPGGFSLAMGPKVKPGVPAEKMTLLGKSDFGSGYLTVNRIGKLNHHLRIDRHRRNWNPEDISWGLQMASMSITNVKSALKLLNGVPSDQLEYNLPIDLSLFDEPWKRSRQIGITSIKGFDTIIEPDYIEPFSKETILEKFRSGQYIGRRRLKFSSHSNMNDLKGNESKEGSGDST